MRDVTRVLGGEEMNSSVTNLHLKEMLVVTLLHENYSPSCDLVSGLARDT